MYQPQNSLPTPKPNRFPEFTQIKIAEVTSNKDFDKKGVVYVRFTKGGRPCPVTVYQHGMYVKPEEGDSVLVGYMEGNKTAPYFAGYEMDAFTCANFFRMSKNGVTVQFPLDAKDAEEHMTDPAKESTRASIRIHQNAMEFSYPVGNSAITIKLNKTGSLDITIPDSGAVNLGGSTPVARKGDTVEVSVPGVGTCSGTITGGSSKVNSG